MTKQWERMGEWALRRGPWRIAKAIVCGTPKYTLTRDGRIERWCGVVTTRILGVYGTAKEAMEAAK